MIFKRYSFLQVALTLFILFGSANSFAQNRYILSGKVFSAENHAPLEDALVYCGTSLSVTNPEGYFEFPDISEGSYQVHVSILGFTAEAKQVKLNRNITNLHFDLEPSDIKLDTVFVEADFLQTSANESTLSADAVDESFLAKNYGNSFSESLEKIPGLSTMNTGVGVGKPVIRGMTFNRVIVNDKGIKQEGQQWGADHGLEVDKFDVERVEVVKGPASLMYGSDGIAGVINILDPKTPKEGILCGEILTQYRSNNDQIGGSLNLKGNFKGWFFRARGSYLNFADFRIPADSFTYNGFILPIYNNRLQNTAGRETNFNVQTGTDQKWGKLSLSVSNFRQKVGFFPGAIGTPRSNQLDPTDPLRNLNVPFQQTNHLKAILNSRILFGKNVWYTEAGFQENIRKEESESHTHGKGPVPQGTLAHKLRLRTFTLNSRFHHRINSHFSTWYGVSAQYQENIRSGFEFLIPDFTTLQSGLFVTGSYELGKFLSVSLGGRIDIGQVKTADYSEPIFESEDSISSYWQRAFAQNRLFLNGSGALGFSWYPNELFNLKLNIGRAFRIPTATELSENGVHHGTFRHERGNPNLNSEIGYMFDLGLKFKKDEWLIRLTPFYNYFTNYIYLRPSGGFSILPDAGQVYEYQQASAIHTGFEVLAEYHPVEALHLSTGAEYVWNLNLDTGLPLPFTPPFSLNFQADYTFKHLGKHFKDFYFGSEYRWAAAQKRVDRNELITPDYHLIQLFTGITLKVKKQPIDMVLRLNNLLNSRYLNHLSRYRILNLPEPGRNFTLQLTVPFNIFQRSKNN